MAITCYNSGRAGNIVFHQAMLLAYAKKYNLEYVIPKNADAYLVHEKHNRNPFGYIQSTGVIKYPITRFTEANIHTQPSYQEIPKMDNIIFDGYYQSFKYFDWCRDYILKKFNLPQNSIPYTSINTRRGDCINSPNFPIAPLEYYQNAVKYMQDKGFNRFLLFGDDQKWNKVHFNSKNFPKAEFEFFENKTEMENYHAISNCLNNITARSTFSLTAAWMNQNSNKIVLVPSTKKYLWWRGQNKDLLTDTGFIEIEFEQKENLTEEKQY